MFSIRLVHSDGQEVDIREVTAIRVEGDRLFIKASISPMAELEYSIGFDIKHPECTISHFCFYAE